MASKVLFITLLSSALSAPAGPPAPYGAPAEVYPDLPPVYNYQYGVNDAEISGSVFSLQESRNNLDTNGAYSVNLPDGRVQVVTFTVNGPEGYVADVKYDGVPAYPEAAPYVPAPVVKVAPAPYHPVIIAKPIVHAPVYHAAPVYHNAPVYHAAPVYHKPSGYVNSPINLAYTPKTYGFTLESNEAAEAEVKEAPAAPAPVAEEPSPVVDETVAPEVVVEEAAPADVVEPRLDVEETAAPAVEEPAAPIVEEPAAPIVEEPAAPIVEEPAAPIVEEPAAPAAPAAPVEETLETKEGPADPETPAYEAPAEERRYRYRFL